MGTDLTERHGSQQECERYKHREWIKGQVMTGLSHSWRGNENGDLMTAIVKDWLDCLEEYPQHKIRAAFIHLLKSSDRKPTINRVVRHITGVSEKQERIALGQAQPEFGDKRTLGNGERQTYIDSSSGWIREYS